ESECDEQAILVPSFPSSSFSGPKVNTVSATIENHLGYAEELARLQRQEHEAHSTAKKNLVLAARDPAGSIVSTSGIPAGSIPAGSVPAYSVPAGDVPAHSIPAGSFPASSVPAGSVDSASCGDPAISESVPAVFDPVHADNSTLPPGNSLGSSEHSIRFPSPSDLGNQQPKAGIFSSSSYDDNFCADITNLASSVAVDPVATKRVNTIHPQSQILGELQSPVQTRIPLPDEKIAIGTKWILKNKRDARRIVVRNKARLVAQGHRQEKGIDYDKVFPPVARIEAIRLFLAFASYMGFMVNQMDVKSAFLYGEIKEVYVTQPKGFEDPHNPKHVYRVVKALYGLHQAPRAWHIILVQVYMDDIIFGSTNKAWCDEFDVLMKGEIEMSAMGELTFFLGLQVKQFPDGIFISQDKFIRSKSHLIKDCDVYDNVENFPFVISKAASVPTDILVSKAASILVGYAANSKAYRVYNLSSKKVEETLNLRYLEDKPNVQGTQDDDSESECDEQAILVPSFPSNSFSGPKVNEVSATIENYLDYAEEIARLQRQEHEAHSIAEKYGFEFSNETSEILHQAEIETRRNLVLAAGDPAGSIVSTGRVPTGSVPAGSIPTRSVPASSVPASSFSASSVHACSVPADGVLAGSVNFAGFDTIPAGDGIPADAQTIPAGTAAATPFSSAISAADKGNAPLLEEDLAKKLQAELEAKFARQHEELTQKAQVKSVDSPAVQAGGPSPSVAEDPTTPTQALPVTPDLAAVFAHADTEVHADESRPDDNQPASEQVSAEHTVDLSTTVAFTSGVSHATPLSSRRRRKQIAKKRVTSIMDNTICIVKNPVFHRRTKHIEIRNHFIRDANKKNLIQVYVYILTNSCRFSLIYCRMNAVSCGLLLYFVQIVSRHPMLLVVQVFLLVVLVHADGLVLAGSCIIPTGSYSFMLIGLVPTGRYVVLAGSVWILLLLK
nr:copia protein [Tanacetum cinerariifolium]